MRTIDYRRHFLGLVIAIAAAAWFFKASTTESPTALQAATIPERHFNVREVDVHAAKALLDQGAIFIDVRARDAFLTHHVAGALLIPLAELRTAIPKEVAAAKDKPIVIYCGDGARSGPEGTAILNDAGYANAVNLQGGMQGWDRAGMPAASGN